MIFRKSANIHYDENFATGTFQRFKQKVESCEHRILSANGRQGLYERDMLIETLSQRFCYKKHPIRQFAALLIRTVLKRHREANFLEQNGFANTIRSILKWY